MDLLAILMRWTHITCVTFLVGSALYASAVLMPAMAGMPAAAVNDLNNRIAEKLRRLVIFMILGALLSGLYNLLMKTNLPSGYHMIFGIKMLLALHIFAVAFLNTKADVPAEKRGRWMTGVALSGLLILLLSAYLRFITTR